MKQISIASQPYTYQELKGTSWYKRFVSAEYDIRLDQYPKRGTLIDREVNTHPNLPSHLVKSYYQSIIDFFLHSDHQLDLMNPWMVLKHLRTIKSHIFTHYLKHHPSLEYLKCASIDRKAAKKKWQDLIKENQRLHGATHTLGIQYPLFEAFHQSDKIMYIAGSPAYLTHDIVTWICPWSSKTEVSCVVFKDDRTRFTTHIPDSILIDLKTDFGIELNIKKMDTVPFTWNEIAEMQQFIKSGGLVFTTDIWIYFDLFTKLNHLGFSINNQEWASLGLFQKPSLQSTIVPVQNGVDQKTNTMIYALADYQKTAFSQSLNLSGASYNPLPIDRFLKGKPQQTFAEYRASQINTFKRIVTRSDIEQIMATVSNCDQKEVLISGCIAHENIVDITPIFCKRSKEVEFINPNQPSLLTSFNYYFTDNLVHSYNKKISDPRQHLPYENLCIDYIGMQKNSRWTETIPLYSKGFLRYSAENSCRAEYLSMNTIELSIGNTAYQFNQQTINPESKCQSAIYLPTFKDVFVGEDSWCLVVVQDKVIYNGHGPCRIPPIGVVVTNHTRFPDTPETVKWSICFNELSQYDQVTSKWMIGGFNLLVYKGVNQYLNLETGMQTLTKEGWFNKQSMQSQETQLLPDVRQPRTVFGRTNHNRNILLVFSGRTEFSDGATFAETISFSENFLRNDEQLDFLINFDGGASAALNLWYHKKAQLLSFPAASDSNPAGISRPLPSYFNFTLTNI